MMTCPSCKYPIMLHDEGQIHVLPMLPMGAKFEPTDQEILGHLEAKIMDDGTRLHPLINEFIPTLEGGYGIWYTHPEKLPGVKIDGQICHFFYRTSKAHSTGTQKQGKVHPGVSIEGKPWWHKTGMAMPILVDGRVKGFKKIFVLYTNSGRKKLEKTNWVMHQYHLGNNEQEKEGEFIFLKVFYQTQTAHCEMKNSDQEMESSTTSNNCKCSH